MDLHLSKTISLNSSLSTSGNSHNFTTDLVEQINLPQDAKYYEIALKSASIPNSWFNISSAIGNNKLRYNNGSSWVEVTIPDGQYSVHQLNDAVQLAMKANGDYTAPSTYYIEIYPDL